MSGTPLAESIRSALAGEKRLAAWQLRSTRRRGHQTYLVKTEAESERQVDGEVHEVAVFVKNGDKLGRATFTIGPGDAAALTQRLEQGVYMAGLGGDQPWTLPAAADPPRVETWDEALSYERARKTSTGIADAWRAAVAAEKEVRPSSMELYCGDERATLSNSSGLAVEERTTRVSLLTLLLADGARPAERILWDERRRAADLDVATIVRRAAEEARDLRVAMPPPSGQYAVVIDADELTAFLDPILQNSSAAALYEKSSRFEVGKPLPIETKGGEKLTVVSNATLPFGLSSYTFDFAGVPGRRVEIVKDGTFVQPWSTKQFADYLQATPTGGFANWEVPAGGTPLAELTNGDRVLYVRSFSWLTPDAARGNFSSEIRVGYLYEKGVRKPVKGGTVSGNVFAALGTARFAKDVVFRGDWFGPAAVRLEGLTIAGA